MAKTKISQSGTPRQEVIKSFGSGVVSWSVFDDLYNEMILFMGQLEFLAKAGLETDDTDSAMMIVEEKIEIAKNGLNGRLEGARIEHKEAGGNGVCTIKNPDKKERAKEEIAADIEYSISFLQSEVKKLREEAKGEQDSLGGMAGEGVPS